MNNYSDIVNRFISTDERLSDSFTYDHYVKGIRKLVHWLAYSQSLGKLKTVNLDVEIPSDNLLLLLIGHSNRSVIRYRYISKLLADFSDASKRNSNELVCSDYFKYLFKRYEDLSIFRQYKGKRNCLVKVNRTLDLYDFFMKNGRSFAGFTRKGIEESVKDHPLCLSFLGMSDQILELDGSHRRSIAYFCGAREILSCVVDITDLDDWFDANGSESMYFYQHWDKFKDISMQISKK